MRRHAMEDHLGKLSDRVAWLEAKLLEEREANDELTRNLIELHDATAPPPPSAGEMLATLQQVLDATATASTKAAAAMDDRVETLVAQRLDAVRAELDERAGSTTAEAERRITDLARTTNTLTTEVEGVRLRMSELAEALTRQFDELGRELDGLGARSQDHDQRLTDLSSIAGAVPDGLVDASTLDARATELRANQARIANELVRFELALRQEVALLAEKVQSATRNGTR